MYGAVDGRIIEARSVGQLLHGHFHAAVHAARFDGAAVGRGVDATVDARRLDVARRATDIHIAVHGRGEHFDAGWHENGEIDFYVVIRIVPSVVMRV